TAASWSEGLNQVCPTRLISASEQSYRVPSGATAQLRAAYSLPMAERSHAEFRFYEELNDFLPEERRKISFPIEIDRARSVKDAIESVGVPHTEVDLIVVDGVSVDFTRVLRGGERVAVYPMFERLDISPVVRLRPLPLRDPRFVADGHLGKLA